MARQGREQRPEPDNMDLKNAAAGEEDTGQAMESGEPDVAGRSRGKIIDEDGTAAGKDAVKPTQGEAEKGEHWESGRHKAGE